MVYPLKEILSLIQSCPYFHSFREDSLDLWNEIYANCNYQPIIYNSTAINYQKVYQIEKTPDLIDLSFIIKDQGKPVGIWILGIYWEHSSYTLNSIGLPLQFPVTIPLKEKILNRLAEESFNLIKEIFQKLKLGKVSINDSFRDESSPTLTPWVWSFIKKGSRLELGTDLYLNLSLEKEEIKSFFRSSYKPLINKGLKTWQTDIIAEFNSNDWAEFRNLHFEVSGKETRTERTWSVQGETLIKKEGFLIFLRDSNLKLVGAAFFRHSRDEGRYDTAAYERSLFDLPLGHAVQWLAIEEFKRRNVKWYYIGEFLNYENAQDYSEKEKSISLFKSGFATNLMPKYKVLLNFSD